MKINDDNIGKFFQESLNDFEVQPDKAVWSSIESKAGIAKGMSVAVKAALLIFAAAAVVVSTYFLLPTADVQKPTTELVQDPTIPSDESIVLTSDETETIESPKEIIKVQQEEKKIETKREVKKPENDKIKTSQIKSIKNQEIVTVVNDKQAEKEIRTSSPEQDLYQAQLVDFSTDSAEPIELIDSVQGSMQDVESRDSAKVSFSENPVICFGEDAVLRIEGGESYLWNTGANTSYLKVSPVQQSDYWVVVTDEFGNQIKHTFTVVIDRECTAIFVPSAFTPNADGVNDVFKAEGVGVESFNMIIFNREGQVVFESNNIDDSWDGSYRNIIMSSRVYFYKISYVDAKGNPHNKQGQVTLIK